MDHALQCYAAYHKARLGTWKNWLESPAYEFTTTWLRTETQAPVAALPTWRTSPAMPSVPYSAPPPSSGTAAGGAW
jgi:hypothetical protein